MAKIILASTSPRRKEILEKTGIPFETESSPYEEDMGQGLPPEDLAKVLSHGKAEAVAKKYNDAIVIGGDTFIAYEGKILGKPHTPEKAKEMLQMLSNKQHSVYSGITVIDSKTGKTISEVVETKVCFRNLSNKEIDYYIGTGESLDRAGAYAIQEIGGILVEKIEGDYYNVMGLPLSKLLEILKKFNTEINPKN